MKQKKWSNPKGKIKRKAIYVHAIRKQTNKPILRKFFNPKKADDYRKKLIVSGKYTGIISFYKRRK